MRSLSKWLLPLLISIATVAYLSNVLDFSDVAGHITPKAMAILIPALIAYGVSSLAIEALALRRILPTATGDFSLLCAARVKAASYLLGLIHYALGAGTLSVLLRRRAGVSLAEAAGVVMTIMMFDLGMLATLCAIGATLISSTTAELQFVAILGIVGVIVGGLALLRAPFSMGPLDRLRDLELFRAARTTPPRNLIELALLRFAFVFCFQMLGWAAFASFGIKVPLADLLVRFSLVALAGVAPAIAGIGPSNLAVVELFKAYGSPENLLACSLTLAAGMIVLRALIGIFFAGEFSREAYRLTRKEEAATGEGT